MCSKEAIESEQAGTPASWLQECCISFSPSNDTLAIAKNDKAVFLASKLQVCQNWLSAMAMAMAFGYGYGYGYGYGFRYYLLYYHY